jgi:hypothetical protein
LCGVAGDLSLVLYCINDTICGYNDALGHVGHLELCLHNMVPTQENRSAANNSGFQQKLNALVYENDRPRVHDLMLVKEIDERRKDNEWLGFDNAALAHELQGFKGSPIAGSCEAKDGGG